MAGFLGVHFSKNVNRTHPSPWQENAYFKSLVWNNKSEDPTCFLLDVSSGSGWNEEFAFKWKD